MPVPPSLLPPLSASPPTLRRPEMESAHLAEVNPTTNHRRSQPSPPAPGHRPTGAGFGRRRASHTLFRTVSAGSFSPPNPRLVSTRSPCWRQGAPIDASCRLAGLPIRGAWTAGGTAAYRLADVRGLRLHVRGRDDPPGVLEGEGQVDGRAGRHVAGAREGHQVVGVERVGGGRFCRPGPAGRGERQPVERLEPSVAVAVPA